MDELFLKGEPVVCKAVLTTADHSAGVLEIGERIVILLSTGKKYMGEVQSFDFRNNGKFVEGKLEIVRYPKQLG